MKPINSLAHGMVDYKTSLTLLLAPGMLGFSGKGAANLVPRVMGAGSLVYSLLTNYELGAKRVIPLKTHLRLDLMSGAMLAAAPWLFGFRREHDRSTWVPHVAVGLAEVGIALASQDRVRPEVSQLAKEHPIEALAA